MIKGYKEKIVEEFSVMETNNFMVKLDDHRIFVCGGLVDIKNFPPVSFRHRFLEYIDVQHNPLENLVIQAEEFKDYFRDGNYSDLLKFEEDIASTCSVVLIFLESAGSLVELGMFCNHPEYYKKLLIVAPEEHTKDHDSFIYLGPLQYIRSKDVNSVAIYPWPKESEKEYSESYLEDLSEVVSTKIKRRHKEETFDSNNQGHIAFLICEIIRVCFPIAKNEIKVALECLGIQELPLSRYLYLLERLKYIASLERSTNIFYFPVNINKNKIQFGKSKQPEKGRPKQIEAQALFISFRQFISKSNSDVTSKRRSGALREIIQRGQENGS
jgi:uncharacterized protein YrzB (UPF0473 family)